VGDGIATWRSRRPACGVAARPVVPAHPALARLLDARAVRRW